MILQNTNKNGSLYIKYYLSNRGLCIHIEYRICNHNIKSIYDNEFMTVAKYKNGELQPIGSKRPKWLAELIEKMC